MGFELTTLVVIGTDCIGSCKSSLHAINDPDGPIFIITYYEDVLIHRGRRSIIFLVN